MYDLLQLLHILVYKGIQIIRPALVPICFAIAWLTVGLGIWNVVSAARTGVQRARRMHQIPCSQCRYFSGNYLLKCPVHPQEALSESAIGCADFVTSELQRPVSNSMR